MLIWKKNRYLRSYQGLDYFKRLLNLRLGLNKVNWAVKLNYRREPLSSRWA